MRSHRGGESGLLDAHDGICLRRGSEGIETMHLRSFGSNTPISQPFLLRAYFESHLRVFARSGKREFSAPSSRVDGSLTTSATSFKTRSKLFHRHPWNATTIKR